MSTIFGHAGVCVLSALSLSLSLSLSPDTQYQYWLAHAFVD